MNSSALQDKDRTKYPITWTQMEVLINRLAAVWEADVRRMAVTSIVAVARGGLVPASWLSHKFQNLPVHVIYAASYTTDHKKGSVNIYVPPSVDSVLTGGQALVVDDIVDTGDTMDILYRMFPMARFTALLHKSHRPLPHYLKTADQVASRFWIEFPWEK